jgi:hypothetical protein
MLWSMLMVSTGVNIERRLRRADARCVVIIKWDDGDEIEWDSVVNWFNSRELLIL